MQGPGFSVYNYLAFIICAEVVMKVEGTVAMIGEEEKDVL